MWISDALCAVVHFGTLLCNFSRLSGINVLLISYSSDILQSLWTKHFNFAPIATLSAIGCHFMLSGRSIERCNLFSCLPFLKNGFSGANHPTKPPLLRSPMTETFTLVANDSPRCWASTSLTSTRLTPPPSFSSFLNVRQLKWQKKKKINFLLTAVFSDTKLIKCLKCLSMCITLLDTTEVTLGVLVCVWSICQGYGFMTPSAFVKSSEVVFCF